MARPRLGLRGTAIFAAIIALAVGWVLVHRNGAAPATVSERSVLAAVPADAILVATLDLAALRNSAAGAALLGRSRDAAGLGELQQLCGSDPLDAADQLALAVPERRDAGFGLYAMGRFSEQNLLQCAERILDKRGGRSVIQPRDGFSVLRDASAKPGAAELAVSNDGLLVIAEPGYVSASLQARQSPSLSIANHAEHSALRAAVGPATLLASAVLSIEQRRSLSDELRAQNQADSPFNTIAAAALGVRIDDRIGLDLLLRCEDQARCARAAGMLDKVRLDEANGPRAEQLGIAGWLRQLTVEQRDRDIHVRGTLTLAEAVALFDKLAFLGRLSGLGGLPSQPAQEAPPGPAPVAPSAAPPPSSLPLLAPSQRPRAPLAPASARTPTALPAAALSVPLGPAPSPPTAPPPAP